MKEESQYSIENKKEKEYLELCNILLKYEEEFHFDALYELFKKTAEHYKCKLMIREKGKERNYFDDLPKYNLLRAIKDGRSGTDFEYEILNAIKLCLLQIQDYREVNPSYVFTMSKECPTKFRDLFYKLLKKNVGKKLNISEPLKFLADTASEYFVEIDEFLQFLVSNPVIIFSYIDKEYLLIKDDNKEKHYVSKLYHFSSNKDIDLFKESSEDFDDFYNESHSIDFKKSEGLILGHGLSPVSETICLLFELGRFKRIASIYELKKSKIFLTGPGWASYNRSAKELIPDEKKRKSILQKSHAFREKLYDNLKIPHNTLEDYNLNAIPKHDNININTINKVAEEYEEYTLFLKSIDQNISSNDYAINKKAILDIIETLSKPSSREILKDKIPTELKLLSFSIFEDIKNLFIIHTIVKHFGSWDKDTFYYTLLQRYHQLSFNGWIKIAIESEKLFDASFTKLGKVDGIGETNLGALYHKHYFFKKGKDGMPLNVIPYTFPSGRVWNRNRNKLKDTINDVILLWDFEESRAPKLIQIISQIDLRQLAIQMSDLFSFCYYFFNKTEF